MGWGLGWGCRGESVSNQPAFTLILKLSMTDPETASMKTKNKQTKKPFGCLSKMKLPGPCLKLIESSDLYGLGLGQSFLMGIHSDSDSKG